MLQGVAYAASVLLLCRAGEIMRQEKEGVPRPTAKLRRKAAPLKSRMTARRAVMGR